MNLSARPYCETRNKLSEELVDLAIKLSIAAAQMAGPAVANTPAFDKARMEAQRLRDECDNLEAELERHRAQHGC